MVVTSRSLRAQLNDIAGDFRAVLSQCSVFRSHVHLENGIASYLCGFLPRLAEVVYISAQDV